MIQKNRSINLLLFSLFYMYVYNYFLDHVNTTSQVQYTKKNSKEKKIKLKKPS